MAGRARLQTDPFWTAFSISLIVLCLIRIPLTGIIGIEGMGYMAVPMEIFILLFTVFNEVTAQITRNFMTPRMNENRIPDGMRFFQFVLRTCLVAGVFLGILFFAGSKPLALCFSGSVEVYIIFAAMAPGIAAASVIGVMRGYLASIRREAAAVLALYFQSLFQLILGIIFAVKYAGQGEKVGALLKQDHFRGIYGAAGAMGGFSAAAVLTMLLLVILCVHAGRRGSGYYSGPGFFGFEDTRDGVRKMYFSAALPTAMAYILPNLGVLTNIRIFTAFASEPVLQTTEAVSDTQMVGAEAAAAVSALKNMTGSIHGRIGGYYCVSCGAAMAVVFLLIIPLIKLMYGASIALAKEDYQGFRGRYQIFLKLICFSGIPSAVFLCVCARAAAGMLLGFESEPATAALRIEAIGIFLYAVWFLLLILYQRIGWSVELMISQIGAFLLQLILSFLFNAAFDIGISAVAWCHVLFPLFSILILFILSRRLVVSRRGRGILIPALTCLGCSLPGALLVLLLQNALIDSLGFLAAWILGLVFFWLFYIVITVLTGAVDKRNIMRLPGGGFVLLLAELMNR